MPDIRLMLWRLRPNSPYYWGGGAFDDYTQILEWRDLNTAKPTEQEINDEWTVYLAEVAAQNAFEAEKAQAETSAVTNYQVLPDWVKTISANDAAQHVHDNVLNGFDQAAMDAFIDNRFQGVTTFAAAAPLILQTFKDIGGQLIMFRNLMEIVIKLLMYIRDLIIKYRSQ